MVAQKEYLTTYRKRKNTIASGEPPAYKCIRSKKPIFVIQKHKARQLHYDFRLEIDGVLVSWAVPKGLAKSPRVKRLAVRTDNHPTSYARFEGVMPANNYGAGTVMVWDRGVYKNIKQHNNTMVSMTQALDSGHIEVVLYGKKVRGSYVLIRLKTNDNQWIVKKIKESNGKRLDASRAFTNKSVLTGRTMQQIKKDAQKSE